MLRIQKRRAGQRQTQNALIGLLSAVSMTRVGLTQLLPLCGSAAWWLSAACMLPGLCVYGTLRLLLRRTHTRTLTDCARKLLGNFGGILIMLALILPLLLDGAASLTALITFFTEYVGYLFLTDFVWVFLKRLRISLLASRYRCGRCGQKLREFICGFPPPCATTSTPETVGLSVLVT